MRILIITQYFPPEVGAPQNRLSELAIRLKSFGHEILVLTAMPNYPNGIIHDKYRGSFYIKDEFENLDVVRSYIYATRSKSLVKRLWNYFSFVISSCIVGGLKVNGKFDFVFCESPPLFLGISAYVISKQKHAKLIFNVSDLWPESAEKLGLVKNKYFLWAAYKLEAFLYKKSILISGQTQGIVADIKNRFPSANVVWLPNGVDLNLYNTEKIESNWRNRNGFNEGDILIAYAGIIGHAQGLDVILRAAKKLKDKLNIKFLIIGSGPLKEDLVLSAKKDGITNVYFFDTVTKDEMPAIVKAYDISIVPLRKLDLFLGAIPSKIFENLSMEKPILLGVDGEARELFINQAKAGEYFIPENDESLVFSILKMTSNRPLMRTFGTNGRNYVNEKFNRNKIAERFNIELQKVISKE